VLQAAASNQSILQQTGAGLAVSALVSTQLASGPAAGTSSSQASSTQQQQQPLTSTNVTKKTESAKLTSSTAAPASGASASAAAVQQAHLQQQHQQAQTTSDAINTENVQAQSQGGAQGVQGDDEDMDEGSAVGGASAASGPNPASASASAVHAGVVVKQLASVVDKSSSNHKQKIKDNSVSSVGSEMVIEPKAEYDDDAHDENVDTHAYRAPSQSHTVKINSTLLLFPRRVIVRVCVCLCIIYIYIFYYICMAWKSNTKI